MSKIYVVGLGPGSLQQMTPRAKDALNACDIIIGYKVYINLIKMAFADKILISSTMKKEVERCREVLDYALEGKTVGLISSGDSGVYGMAGIMLEVAKDSPVSVEIISGVTASNAGAALLGAPLMHDYATISLSDLMTPFDVILKRVEYASLADFVICLYNPKSKGRPHHIDKVRQLMLAHRDKKTPVGIARYIGRKGENITLTTLDKMLNFEIDMFSIVIIGNSQTYIHNHKMITPRGYLNR